MARLPSWRDQLPKGYAGASKWGTGINPVHSKRTGYEGRNIAPGQSEPIQPGMVSLDFGYVDDTIPGMDTSYMSEHPNLSDPSIRGRAEGMPPWGNGYAPIPQGSISRLQRRGYNPRENDPNQKPNAEGGDGWENKNTGPVLDSVDSDPAQIFVQTSQIQRDAVRMNTAATVRGTDDNRWEISSRIPGMRVKTWSGGYRHEDMLPREQNYGTRPWKYRGAGTGDPSWMEANAFQSAEPRTRQIPADVYQGVPEDADADAPDEDWYI